MSIPPPESIGQRIARLRLSQGLTQQALAARLAISRVAVSHIEMDLSLPSERTITLLAGIFKLTPAALVEGATYPLAKAERLPAVTCCYTQVELELALLENDLSWLARAHANPDRHSLAREIVQRWRARLGELEAKNTDEREAVLLQKASRQLEEMKV